jgi:hypothetical protein
VGVFRFGGLLFVDEVAVHEVPVPSIECRLPLAALGLYHPRSEGSFWFAFLTGSNGLQLGLVPSHEGCRIFSHHGVVRRHWSGCSLPVEGNPIGQCRGAERARPACDKLVWACKVHEQLGNRRGGGRRPSKAPLPAAFWGGKLGDAAVFLVRACCSQDIFTIAPLQARSVRGASKPHG